MTRSGSNPATSWISLLFALSPGTMTGPESPPVDRKSTRLNSSHLGISYAVFCLKKKNRLHLPLPPQLLLRLLRIAPSYRIPTPDQPRSPPGRDLTRRPRQEPAPSALWRAVGP